MRETLEDKVRQLVMNGMAQEDFLDPEKVDARVNSLTNLELLAYIDEALNHQTPEPPMSDKLFNVIAVNIETRGERTVAENKTEQIAEAICGMGTMRRGDTEFFKIVPVTQ